MDISKGLILANTISGSAIIINVNANASSDIIIINIGNSNGVKINTDTTSDANAITINGVRLATTQHIKNVIPYGVIMAYYSTPAPPGWAICDGSNGTPDLRGKFILGGGINAGGRGGIISSDNSYIYHTFLTSGTFIPTEITSVNVIVVGGGGSGASFATTGNVGTVGGKGGTVIQQTNHDVSMNTFYTITVGAGGAPSNSGSPGGDSSFNNITAPGGNRTSADVSNGTLVNIFNTSYYMGGDGGLVYYSELVQINGGAGGGGGSGNTFYNQSISYIPGKGGVGGINPGGDGQPGIGGNGGANTGGGGGGVYFNNGTPGAGGDGIVIVYYPHTSITSNGSNRLTPRPIGVSGGEENTRLNLDNIPAHVHNYNFTEYDVAGSIAAIKLVQSGSVRRDGEVSYVGGTGLGLAVPHNNMPPFYVLIYIMKTSNYDFCYNLVAQL